MKQIVADSEHSISNSLEFLECNEETNYPVGRFTNDYSGSYTMKKSNEVIIGGQFPEKQIVASFEVQLHVHLEMEVC